MELVDKLRACFFGSSCKGHARSRLGNVKHFVSTDLNHNSVFSFTWSVARQIY